MGVRACVEVPRFSAVIGQRIQSYGEKEFYHKKPVFIVHCHLCTQSIKKSIYIATPNSSEILKIIFAQKYVGVHFFFCWGSYMMEITSISVQSAFLFVSIMMLSQYIFVFLVDWTEICIISTKYLNCLHEIMPPTLFFYKNLSPSYFAMWFFLKYCDAIVCYCHFSRGKKLAMRLEHRPFIEII